MSNSKPFRVLSIDGGGMRGLYTATYLSSLAKQYAGKRNAPALDVGKGFDLIVGTSTGGIIACGLAAGIDLDRIAGLYSKNGRDIFPAKMPSGLSAKLIVQLFTRPRHNRSGAGALEGLLREHFGKETVAEVYARRGIAFAIPAVEMSKHRSWVFKTPHLPNNVRDNEFSLVDVCVATSAAPIYRSLGNAHDPRTGNTFVFADGGLWANNPVLVGLIDALYMNSDDRDIEIFSLGTCSRPAGKVIDPKAVHWGFSEWKFGGEVAPLSIDAQQFAYDNMARMLAPHLKKPCHVVRFPHGTIAADAMKYLDLDETSEEGLKALEQQAHADVSQTLSDTRHVASPAAQRLAALLDDLPATVAQGS